MSWRQLKSILTLPLVVAIVVPTVLVQIFDDSPRRRLPKPLNLISTLAGFLLIAMGLTLLTKTIALFHKQGQGTLAPWDPPRKLVVRGVYRYVRNPMISGVFFALLGEAVISGSLSILLWFFIFVIGNAIYVPLSEEPALLKRFGHDYEIYRKNVPRWTPRFTPWTPDSQMKRQV